MSRPINLEEFKGKDDIKKNIEVYIKSCKVNNQVLDHCLFYGLPGTGKTTLAKIIANELERKIHIVQGNTLIKNIDIINVVLTLNENDILFIDEIHAINPLCMELLYSVMEDFCIDIKLGKDFETKITRIEIPKFTLIGATTFLGKIPQALEERFGIVINLKPYDEKSLCEIISSLSIKSNLLLNENEILLIANNSRGIPRNAIRILKRVIDFRNINKKISVKKILTNLQIIKNGLNVNDLSYLITIKKQNKPLGLKTLSQISGIDQNTIEVKIEPFLLRNGYIIKTNLGRLLTNKSQSLIKKYESKYSTYQ